MTRAGIPLVLLAMLAAPAAAQDISCTANAGVPVSVRVGGSAELVGDILLACSGVAPTVVTVNIQLFLNVAVTSRQLASGVSRPWTEALLLIDDPPPASQFPCVAATGTCTYERGGTFGPGSRQNKNVFQATRAGENSLEWSGVPLDLVGAGGPYPTAAQTRVFRIKNVRVAIPRAFGGSLPSPVTAFLAVTSSTSVLIANPTVTVAFAVPGLAVTALDATGAPAPAGGISVPACVANVTRVATLRFIEGFQTAFRTRSVAAFVNPDTSPVPAAQNEPGTIYFAETGFYNPSFPSGSTGNLALAGLADSGTRLSVSLANIPSGVSLFVDPVNLGFGRSNVARLVTVDARDASVFSPAGSKSDPVQISEVSGTAVAVWEVLGADPAAINTVEFGVYLSITASTTRPSAVRFFADFSAGSSTSIPRFSVASVSDSSPVLLNLGTCTLTITTTSPLPEAIRGWSYNLSLTGAGGVSPYLWSASALPPDWSLSSTGVLSGTPTAQGSQPIRVTLRDSGSPPATLGGTLAIEVLPEPSFNWDPPRGTVDPNQQLALRLSPDSAYRLTLSGQVRASFQPDPANAFPSSANEVTFADGAGQVSFQLPAGSTQAQFGAANSAPFRTGTIAGTISFAATADITNRGARLVSPEIPSPQRLTVDRKAPVLTQVRHLVDGNSLYVCADAFATGREVREAAVEFRAAAGRSIEAPASPFDVRTPFEDFYRNHPSRGSFEFLKSYRVEGTITDIDAVTVGLNNSLGASNRLSVSLTDSSRRDPRCRP